MALPILILIALTILLTKSIYQDFVLSMYLRSLKESDDNEFQKWRTKEQQKPDILLVGAFLTACCAIIASYCWLSILLTH